MKKIMFTIFVFMSVTLMFAQPMDLSIWNNFRYSAQLENNQIAVRLETIDLPNISTSLFYSNGNTWNVTEMENINALTYQSVIPFENTINVYCRMKTETDTLVALMPSLCDNSFPQNNDYLSLIATDPENDFLTDGTDNSDITASYFGYSENKFFVGLENASGQFPLNNGGWIPSEYYFYMTTLINPESALQDSIGYAIVYGQVGIPGVFGLDPGLYKIQVSTELSIDSFEFLGNIESTNQNGMLQIALDKSILINDPDFGDWPNATNSLIVTPLTITVNTSLEPTVNDIGKFALMKFEQFIIEPFENILPTIYMDNNNTQVHYYDENGNFPIIAQVIFDNDTPYDLYPLSFDFSEEVIYDLSSLILTNNPTEVDLRFSDNGIDFVNYSFVDNSNEAIPTIETAQFYAYPNPFNPETKLYYNFENKEPQKASITIFNSLGQKVYEAKLNPKIKSGFHIWNGTNTKGKQISSGIYFTQLQLDNENFTTKLILLK